MCQYAQFYVVLGMKPRARQALSKLSYSNSSEYSFISCGVCVCREYVLQKRPHEAPAGLELSV